MIGKKEEGTRSAKSGVGDTYRGMNSPLTIKPVSEQHTQMGKTQDDVETLSERMEKNVVMIPELGKLDKKLVAAGTTGVPTSQPFAVRTLPFDIHVYGPSRVHCIYTTSTFAEVFSAWAKVILRMDENAEVSQSGGSITATRESTDPTASYKRAMFEFNFWQTREQQVMVELILLTDDALDATWDKLFAQIKQDPECSRLQ